MQKFEQESLDEGEDVDLVSGEEFLESSDEEYKQLLKHRKRRRNTKLKTK